MVNKYITVILLCVFQVHNVIADEDQLADIKAPYSQPIEQWPMAITADGHLPKKMAPLDTKVNDETDKQALGKRLFFDPILSRNQTVSCGSCHEARLQFADARRTAIGTEGRVGKRNTPALFAMSHWTTLFWDGRANDLRIQALMPIANHDEMDLPLETALQRLNATKHYQQWFSKVYQQTPITLGQLADAIVSFELTIPAPQTRFQQFIRQAVVDPETALEILSESELKGLHLFRTKAKCMTCHQGPLLSDNQFHASGLHYYGRKFQDLGRYNVTGKVEDAGTFRTPSLVGLTLTSPWMHNGLFEQLDGIINLYNAGGPRPKPRKHQVDDPLFPKTSPLLHKLNLSQQEKADLLAFLQTL